MLNIPFFLNIYTVQGGGSPDQEYNYLDSPPIQPPRTFKNLRPKHAVNCKIYKYTILTRVKLDCYLLSSYRNDTTRFHSHTICCIPREAV